MRKIVFQILKIISFSYHFKKKKNSLLILMFHQVNNKTSVFYPPMPISVFKELCIYIKSNYEIITPSSIKIHFQASNKPAAIISFDDAHYDIMENAFPILTELEMPFNINVDTEVLDTGKPQDFVRVYDILNNTSILKYTNSKYFSTSIIIDKLNPMSTENQFTNLLSRLTPEQKREVVVDLATVAGMNSDNYSKMLSKEDVQYLSSKGVEFGSHSHTHSILSEISEDQLEYELKHSKQILESIIKKDINILAYPNGLYNKNVKSVAKKIGYSIFLETEDRINYIDSNNKLTDSYTRVNQYHSNLNEALAHTYGITKYIKRLMS